MDRRNRSTIRRRKFHGSSDSGPGVINTRSIPLHRRKNSCAPDCHTSAHGSQPADIVGAHVITRSPTDMATQDRMPPLVAVVR
jgi:hypothetical protein